jgi:protein-S-isoprenylcysteine O-methyltransferase Ste14
VSGLINFHATIARAPTTHWQRFILPGAGAATIRHAPGMAIQLSFLLLFASAVAIRVRYQRLAGTYREGIATHTENHLAHEAKPLLIIRPLLGFPWYAVVMCWFFAPQWISWSFLHLSLWARAAGLIVGGLGLLLLWRSHAALGRNFRPTLETAPDHELITHGPYNHIRHPLYAAFLLMLAATGLLSSNWFIGVVGVLLIASITVVRIPAEEHLLSERFGERYRVYRESTPPLVPVFHSSARKAAAG